ncbi:MAG TPA: type II toxin-antitoxin system HicA family toxin [Isosphaeraceae bacterium]|nr:type II toxin-antitoxin system HicA family toxin [Isosphaeraceae bacterium]
MSKLRVLAGHEVRSILERHGFPEVRRRGSHIVMQRQDPDTGTTTVPVPDHKELRIGTLRAIIRQSGIPRGEFEVIQDRD